MRNVGYLAFAVLGLIWGTNFIFMKWAVALISPAQIVFVRVLCGFVPILILALATRALSWRHVKHFPHFLVMALLATALYYFAFAKSAGLLPSSVAGMLSGAIPLFTFLTALIFLREEPLNRYTTSGIALGFLGVLCIARPWASLATGIDPWGVLYMVLGSLSVGCSFVYAKRFLTGLNISPIALCTYQIGLALVIIALVTDMHGIRRLADNPRALIGAALGLGFLGTGVAFMLYYFIVARLGALVASSATYIPPIVALFIGYFLAGEHIGLLDLVAVAAIFAGVYALQIGRRVARRQVPELVPAHTQN